jgi:hypothetical protein
MTWFRLARLSIATVCLGLSACVILPETQPEAPATSPARAADGREVSQLLAWFERLASQPTEEQKREFTAAQAAFEQSPNESNRLRLVLALCLPQAPWRDDARVISMIAEWSTDTSPTLRRQVAQLLYRLTVERQRLIKDEQRRADVSQQGELRRTEALLHDERKKVEDLQQKLDALREIDRNTLKPARK